MSVVEEVEKTDREEKKNINETEDRRKRIPGFAKRLDRNNLIYYNTKWLKSTIFLKK